MKPEAQRIAIAKACGEINPRYTENGAWIASTNTTDGIEWGTHGLPDYLKDLNAMHKAEQVLDREQRNRYINVLDEMFEYDDPAAHDFEWCCATAAQRAEAFLKTLNLWNT